MSVIPTDRALEPVLPGSSRDIDMLAPEIVSAVTDVVFDADACSFCVLSGWFDARQSGGRQENRERDTEFDG